MMDVTFVLEESGATATVEVPCDANVAEAKRVACTEFAVSPASVEVRIGTEVVDGTCRLQDTAIGAGVQVVLSYIPISDILCPAEFDMPRGTSSLTQTSPTCTWALSCCGTLCVIRYVSGSIAGFDTATFETAFSFPMNAGWSDEDVYSPPAISHCKTRCYVPCGGRFADVYLPEGRLCRFVPAASNALFAAGRVVVSQHTNGLSVFDEDLMLLHSLAHKECEDVVLSKCGKRVVTSSSFGRNARVWDTDTGCAVACVPAAENYPAVALVPYSMRFAVVAEDGVRVYEDSDVVSMFSVDGYIRRMQFTPCGRYVLVQIGDNRCSLHQYDVATLSCVLVIPGNYDHPFTVSPCSRFVVFQSSTRDRIVSRHLHPHNE